jgi:hypothetical protein
VALGGTVAVVALGSDSRTLIVRAFALGSVWLAGLVAGFSAWLVGRGAPGSVSWPSAVVNTMIGVVIGAGSLVLLWAIIFVVGAEIFAHSNFVW